jgi:hypothetical protein
MILAWLLLLTGLILSAVAIYYSVVGLTAIFSAAVIPIMVMGGSLEVAKLVCASWLKANWERAPRFMKYYMITAVTVLMVITSMGIFGFLSKAHNDQNLVSGDVQSKIAIYDEKIKTARENIDANRRQLKQMDEAVDQVMARSTSEEGATKANNIRRAQQKDRTALAKDTEANQKLIAQLNDEAAPIRAEVRKVEAEVGPIKYIAKLIYGDSIDENILEKAVTWIIILIVTVFDPLAVIMLLAAQMTFGWGKDKEHAEGDSPERIQETEQPTVTTSFTAQEVADVIPEAVVEESTYEPLHCYKCGTELFNAPGIGPYCPNKECDVVDNTSGAEPIEFTFTPPASLYNKEIEDKLWAESVANVPEQNYPTVTWPKVAPVTDKPKKERKPRAKKETVEVTPKRNKQREEEQSALLTQFIESTTSVDTNTERPGDYISTSTVTREGSQDELDNKYQEMVQELQPEKQSKYRRKPGFFPEVKRNTDNT